MKALQVRIRKAGRHDIDRIVGIERSWHHLSHWSVDSYYRLMNDSAVTSSYVAETEDESGALSIVGFVIFHIAAGTSEIYNIAVDVAHARLGIGGQLMAVTVEESRKRLAGKLMLEVRKSNQPAINFYLGYGFRQTGERKNYYSNPIEDAFVMEKNLDSPL